MAATKARALTGLSCLGEEAYHIASEISSGVCLRANLVRLLGGVKIIRK